MADPAVVRRAQHEKFQSAPGSRVGTPAYLAPEVIMTTKGQTYDGKVRPRARAPPFRARRSAHVHWPRLLCSHVLAAVQLPVGPLDSYGISVRLSCLLGEAACVLLGHG